MQKITYKDRNGHENIRHGKVIHRTPGNPIIFKDNYGIELVIKESQKPVIEKVK